MTQPPQADTEGLLALRWEELRSAELIQRAPALLQTVMRDLFFSGAASVLCIETCVAESLIAGKLTNEESCLIIECLRQEVKGYTSSVHARNAIIKAQKAEPPQSL